AARPDQAKELAARNVERGVAQRAHVAGVALLAELMRDAPDPDRDFIGAHEYGLGCNHALRGAESVCSLSPRERGGVRGSGLSIDPTPLSPTGRGSPPSLPRVW